MFNTSRIRRLAALGATMGGLALAGAGPAVASVHTTVSPHHGWVRTAAHSKTSSPHNGWGVAYTTPHHGWGNANTLPHHGWGNANTLPHHGWGTANTAPHQGWTSK